jgi:hypothetical protein
MKTARIAIFALFLLSAVAAAKTPFTVSAETTAITGPLREDGTVDYIAALNQHYGQNVTPDNNGFVEYLRAIGPKSYPSSIRSRSIALLGATNLDVTATGWKAYPGDGPLDRTNIRSWKPKDFPAYADYLKAQGPWLDLAEQAAAKPQWWAPSVSTNGTFGQILLPELNTMRGISMALCSRALLRANQGDFDGFLADVIAAKRLARDAAGFTFIGALVETNIDYLADRTIGGAAGAGIFSSAQCASLAKDVGERWAMLDVTQWIAMGKIDLLAAGSARDDEWLRPFRSLDRDSVDWDSVMRTLNAYCDEVTKILQAPTVRDEQIARQLFDLKVSAMRATNSAHPGLALEPGETKDAYTQRVTAAIFIPVFPSSWRAEDTCRSGPLEDQMARTDVAAAKYRADNGHWPDSLQQLIPAYLPQVPTEVFSATPDQPIRYQQGDSGICVVGHGPRNNEITIGVGQEMGTEGL